MAIRRITGTSGSDKIRGTSGADLIRGLDGDDKIRGEDGNDQIDGGTANDTISGGDGNDTIRGGAGSEWKLRGGRGNDEIFGGDGADWFAMQRGDGGRDILRGENGRDLFFISFVQDPWRAFGGTGRDYFSLELSYRGAVLDGGSGQDVLSVQAYDIWSGGPTDLRLVARSSGGTIKANGEVVVTFSSAERFEVEGDIGDDLVQTLGANDHIRVWTGANSVKAGGGADFVSYVVGEANDLDGGTGRDTLQINASPRDRVVFDAVKGRDFYGSTIKGFEAFEIQGHNRDDKVATLDGDDTLDLAGGDDVGSGRGGNDSLYGGEGDDNLSGGDGNDKLQGDAGCDRLAGGKGDDVLSGGAELDQLTGGEGSDTFVFARSRNTVDEIRDFGSGQDKIEIYAYDLDSALPPGPVDAARFHQGAAVGTEGQFILINDGDNDRLVWDANGADAGGEVQIMLLLGDSGFTASDIIIV